MQLRIWHIGTDHDFEPDDSSWPVVIKWLEAGVRDPDKRNNYAMPATAVDLYADFLVCPIEPYKKGSVQRATIKSAERRHYVELE